MSEGEYQDFLKKRKRVMAASPKPEPPIVSKPAPAPDVNKYLNVKVYVYEDGFVSYKNKVSNHGKLEHCYDSIKEYQRYNQLLLFERSGIIKNLRRQESLVIEPAFIDSEGKKQRAITYKADFCYEEDGKEVVEDVKAYDKKRNKFLGTETFHLKWKLLKARYPDKVFRLY